MHSTDTAHRARPLALIAFAVMGIFSMCVLTACNTTEGFGRDVKSLGDSIEDAAN